MYTPPQEQEQNKNNLSRNCTEKCAHNMTHSLDCERYKSITLVCHAYPSPSNSNLSPLTSHLSPITSAPPPSPLASHLSPPTRQLSPLTVHLSPSDTSPSPLQIIDTFISDQDTKFAFWFFFEGYRNATMRINKLYNNDKSLVTNGATMCNSRILFFPKKL